MKELKEYGYVKRTPIRNDKNKIVSWETVIHEVPQEGATGGFSTSGESTGGNPSGGKSTATKY